MWEMWGQETGFRQKFLHQGQDLGKKPGFDRDRYLSYDRLKTQHQSFTN